MTSKLTRDIIQSEIVDFFAGVVEIHTELGGPNSVEEAQKQLTERVLACVPAVDSEPVAWDYEWASYIICDGPQDFKRVIERKAPPEWAIKEGRARDVIPLYRHAQQPVVEEWTDGQCLEFLSIAFRHAEIKGDLATDDIRLGIKMVNACRPVERKAAQEGGSARVHPARNE